MAHRSTARPAARRRAARQRAATTMHPLRPTRHMSAALVAALALATMACQDSRSALAREASAATAEAPARERSDVRRQYGPAVKVGQGQARTYVVYDQKNGGAPIELGVALDERAMDGLPGPNPNLHAPPASAHEHVDNHVYLLSLPKAGAAPFQFVELDWNPGGHEPPGIYDTPHFDFHFYTVPQAERAAIVPSDPEFQRKADMLPPEAQRPPQYVVAAPPGASAAPAVPLMGVHWVDVRSPELQQMFGKPEAYKPFTTTFLYGSWAGRVHFLEPMITRAYIMQKKTATDPAVRDEVIPISTPPQVGTPGYYPDAYRIAYDPQAREYRIALTGLAWRK